MSPAERRPVWVGTSWKMTKTIPEALEYAGALARATRPPGVQAFVLPAHTALAAVRDALPDDGSVLLGAQDAHWGPEGAGTGQVSMRMVADAGATIVELGHSERRADAGETDEVVARKVRAATDAGLVPLVCVGEQRSAREAGAAEDAVLGQLTAALAPLDAEEVARVLVAYEPVWAIGEAGRPATPAEVAPVMAALADGLRARSGGAGPRALLYGGSVDADVAGPLLADPHTDGLFVGRAAWTVAGLLALLEVAARHAAAQLHSSERPTPQPADVRGAAR